MKLTSTDGPRIIDKDKKCLVGCYIYSQAGYWLQV